MPPMTGNGDQFDQVDFIDEDEVPTGMSKH